MPPQLVTGHLTGSRVLPKNGDHMMKIYILTTVALSVLAGCAKSDADLTDCSKIASERERAQCLAHKEATKDTGLTKAQQSPPKAW